MEQAWNIRQQKQFFRKKARAVARQFYSDHRERCSSALHLQLETLSEYHRPGPLFCFVGTAFEPDTSSILQDALRAGRPVAVPRCTGPGSMEARLIRDLGDLKEGFYGIPEPPADAPLLPRDQIAFAVVPCLCCDQTGIRLGHGGGYYDRYLASAAFPWAVLCPEALLVGTLPCDAFDLRAPALVTDRRVFEFEKVGPTQQNL